jgi:PAS domain S-box-containing protein
MPERPRAIGATPSEAFPPERLSDVLERAPAIVWLWDPETGCTYVSAAWTRILGREPAEAWGDGWASSVHPDDLEAFEACRAAMRRNEPFAAEYRLRRTDGRYATVNDQGYALEPGEVPGPFLGAALEVTAQRAAETLVRAGEALLSAVAEGMGVALGVKDRAGRYLIANDAMSATLGVAPGAAIGHTDRELDLTDWDRRDAQDQAVLTGADPILIEDDVDGTTVLTTKSPLRGPGEGVEGVIVVGTDISAERHRRAQAERLDRVTQALSSSSSVQEVADAVFLEALDALEAPAGALGLTEPDGGSIAITRLRGFESKRDPWRLVTIDAEDTPITRGVRDGTSAFYRSADALIESLPHLEGQLLDYEGRAVLPLRGDRGVLGVLYVAYAEERVFDAGERAYALAIADRIAQALERARLFDAARRSDEQTRTLQGVTADLGGALTVLEVELVTTRAACAAVSADACLLGIVDARRTSVRYADTDAYPEDLRTLLPTTMEPGSSPVADVIASGASLVFETSTALVAAYPRLAGLIDHLPFRSRVFVPVGAPGAAAGVLITSSGERGHFDAEAIRLLEAIGGQCGQALQRAILYRDARAASERAAALQAATTAIAEATTVDDVVEPAVTFSMDLVEATIGALVLIDADANRVTVAHQVGASAKLFEGLWDVAAEGAARPPTRSLTGDDLRRRTEGRRGELDELGIVSVVLVPLTSGGDELGFLALGGRDDAALATEIREVLESLAERVGAAIHRARLLDAERRTRRDLERALSRLSRLQAVSDAMSQAVPVEEVAESALDASMDALGAIGAGAYLVDGDVLRRIAARGVFASAASGLLDAIPVDADMAMCASFASGTVEWVPTRDEWQRRYPRGAFLFDGIARSSIAIPFVVKDRVLGVMTLVFADEGALDRPERRMARTIGHQAAIALERSQLYEREMARSRRTEQIQHLIAELAGSQTAAAIAAVLTSTALDVLGACAAAVILRGDDAVDVAAGRGYPRSVLDAIRTDDAAPGRVAIQRGRSALLGNLEAVRDRYPELANDLGEATAELPLIAGGATIGALLVSFERPQPFDLEQFDLLTAIASEAAQATQRARVSQREREISRILQDSLLPDEPISSWNGAQVTTWYSAGTEYLDVGGDWYDVIELPDGRLGVSIGDVVGRGLRAAAAMGQLRSALRGLALEMRGPGPTLQALNRFAASAPGTELATVAYGEYDPMSGAFVYACAGHPPPVACVGGRAVVLDGGRSPLLAAGYDGDRKEGSCILPPGSTLILYTDGLIERRDEPFHRGVDRLRATLERTLDRDPAQLVEEIVDAVLGQQERTDDAAVLLLRTGAPIPFTSTLDGSPEELRPLRHRLRAWLDLRGCASEDAEAVVLAANEAAANAIEHGYRGSAGGPVEISGDFADRVLTITVVDHGVWRASDPDPVRGRGIPLMRTLMDDVEVQALDPGTKVVLRRRVAPLGTEAMAGAERQG